MSLIIIKKGMADTIQDKGRTGFQHLGIQANGFMDYLSAQLANVLVNNPINYPVFELCFPASSFSFTSDHTICITGANFSPVINEKSIDLNTPIEVTKNDVLQFLKPIEGSFAYLAIQGKINAPDWLASQSFNTTTLQKDNVFDILPILESDIYTHTIPFNLIKAIQNNIYSRASLD